MDFERSAIKTLFYDFPVETALQILEDKKIDFLKDYFSDITRWRDTTFTVSEWRMLENVLNDCWLGKPLVEVYPQLGRALNLLAYVGGQILTINSDNEPRVQFKNLFRWRDISLIVGEDALSLAYLALHDVCSDPSMPERTLFLWGNILSHDNKQLNQLLNNGLADVHHHFVASADIFHLNWIYLMNTVPETYANEWLQSSQEQQYHPLSSKMISSPKCQCITAAYLREVLHRIFVLVDDSVENIDNEHLYWMLYNEEYARQQLPSIQGSILEHKDFALKTADEQYVLDYAIPNTPYIEQHTNNIALIYHGERDLMYSVFFSWFRKEEKAYKYGGYFYLYLLLKSHIRREFVETNRLHGFENFSITQTRKIQLLPPALKKLIHRIIVQSEVGETAFKNYIETRIAPDKPQKMHKILAEDYSRSVLTNDVLIEDVQNNLSFVVHYLKTNDKEIAKDGVERYAEYRQKLYRSFDGIMSIVRQQNPMAKPLPKIVGIDAAGSELKCRPEVFGHLFRYAAKLNVLGRTYHVGEDFYDLADGLRAIDEAILYLQLDINSRIGHALALSVDAKDYYAKRHYKMLISKQALLDNCVWLYYKAKEYNIVIPGELELFLQNTAMTYYAEIGYGKDFDLLHYWHSMLLRGNDDKGESRPTTLWNESADVESPSVKSATNDVIAMEIKNKYLKSAEIKIEGNKACANEYPKQIVPLIEEIQKAMIREIAEKGIAIECCPSSNVMIGGFERYDKHPIFTFKPIEARPTDPIINVSINTDDAGIFATNISNEYSLITLAMMKMKDENGHRLYNDETIYDYIERVRANGMIQRFKVD